MNNSISRKFGVQIIVLLFSIATLLLVLTTYRQNDIYNLKYKNTENGILLSWDNSLPFNKKKATVTVKNKDEIVKEIKVGNGVSSLLFEEVEHGKRYDFEIKNDGLLEDFVSSKEISCMYLDYNKMPALPIINIETKGNVLPGFTVVQAPNNLFGSSIKDNEYVDGNIAISCDGKQTTNQNIQIKVRGNTSASYDKTPYEILLSEEEDLLNTNYKDNEFVLLGTGESFNMAIGLEISRYLAIEWQPKYEYVNLIINGDYKGCYILAEKVKKAEGRVDITDNGFLFENDAYWWNAGSEFFRTEHQDDVMGYTFKYPYKITESKIKNLKKYMNEFEEYLLNNDERYTDYIDIDLFARWLLYQDILGVKDAGGTNMYLYKYDFDNSNPTSTKVKIGPNWDFDSMFRENHMNNWSYIHNNTILYFDKLLLQDNFKKTYYDVWKQISGNLYNDVDNFINSFDSQYGIAVQESWDLDSERWNKEIVSLQETYLYVLNWFKNKIVWIDTNIEIYNTK